MIVYELHKYIVMLMQLLYTFAIVMYQLAAP